MKGNHKNFSDDKFQPDRHACSLMSTRALAFVKRKIFPLFFSDGLLHIDYSTGIDSVPDIIHGEMNMKNLSPLFKSGVYNPQGTTASRVQVSRLDIVPKSPFAFSTKWWSKFSSH